MHAGGNEPWLASCLLCGKDFVPSTDPLGQGPAAIELGFAEPGLGPPPTGVGVTASFSWAMEPTRFHNLPDDTRIVDEYGAEFSKADFLRMLHANCGIQFTHSVGLMFC